MSKFIAHFCNVIFVKDGWAQNPLVRTLTTKMIESMKSLVTPGYKSNTVLESGYEKVTSMCPSKKLDVHVCVCVCAYIYVTAKETAGRVQCS